MLCSSPALAAIHSHNPLSVDAFGQRLGRVHMQKQDLNTMATRRFKALKKKKDTDGDAAEGDDKPAKKARANAAEDASDE